MTINLIKKENQHWPLFRVLVMPPGHWTDSKQPWEILPAAARWDIYGAASGYEFLRSRRVALPDLGIAQFRFRFGRIDGKLYGVDSLGGARDLSHYAVRIQAASAPSNEQVQAGFKTETLRWGTVWVGTIEHQQDSFLPGANYQTGDRIYHCEDLLGVTKRWAMQSHGYDFDGDAGVCRGHPGYNRRDGDGALSGNRGQDNFIFFDDAPTSGSYTHTVAGQGDLWTDAESLTNALFSARSKGSPVFTVQDACGLLNGQEAWDVDDNDCAWDVLNRICQRQRGRGVVFSDWADDVIDSLGNLSLNLAVRAQSLENIVYTKPSAGGIETILGANATGTAVNIDLEGDHRIVPGSFRLGGRAQHQVDYLETPGERIEVVITGGYPDGLWEEKWSIGSAVAFDALGPDERRSDKYDLVYHLHGHKNGFRFFAGNGDGSGTNHVFDYRCVNGGIGQPSSSVLPESSLATAEILENLPIPTDPAPGARFTRSSPLLLMKIEDDKFIDGRRHLGLELRIREDGFHISKNDWDDEGYRYVGDMAMPTQKAAYDYTGLSLTYAIKLPHRVMYSTGDRETSGRRLVLPIAKDMRLWLLSNDAVTGLDLENGGLTNGYPPERGVLGSLGGTTYRILRDDRDRLARRHFLAWSWYGVARQTITYQMKGCMLLPSFEVEDERGVRSEVTYPRLGQVIDTVQAGGVANVSNTPITGVDYDNEIGVSTLESDWSDLDLRTS
jgi:hypothetical protein